MADCCHQPIVRRHVNKQRNAAGFSPEVGKALHHLLILAKIRRNDGDRTLKQIYAGGFQPRFLGASHWMARYIETSTFEYFGNAIEKRTFDTRDVGYNRAGFYIWSQMLGHGRYRRNRRCDKD